MEEKDLKQEDIRKEEPEETVKTEKASEEKKPEVGKITLSSDKLRRYFPKSYTPQQMEQTIFRLLEQWQRRRQRDLER